jgi:hypothetical protein
MLVEVSSALGSLISRPLNSGVRRLGKQGGNVKVTLVLLLACSTLCLAAELRWDGKTVPITVQALKDVSVRPTQQQASSGNRMERGVLYSRDSFLISAGQLFTVVALEREGMCTIEYSGKKHSLLSCPWMDGFTDRQVDVFKIVAIGTGT